MTSIFRFKYVDIDAKKLTVSLFRQLPIVHLCNERGIQDNSLVPVGTVRYKHEGKAFWVLALQEEQVVRCPLDPELRPRKSLEESFEFWSKSAAMPHNLPKGEDSVAHREAERYRLAIEVEPLRHALHSEAAKLEQIFL